MKKHSKMNIGLTFPLYCLLKILAQKGKCKMLAIQYCAIQLLQYCSTASIKSVSFTLIFSSVFNHFSCSRKVLPFPKH